VPDFSVKTIQGIIGSDAVRFMRFLTSLNRGLKTLDFPVYTSRISADAVDMYAVHRSRKLDNLPIALFIPIAQRKHKRFTVAFTAVHYLSTTMRVELGMVLESVTTGTQFVESKLVSSHEPLRGGIKAYGLGTRIESYWTLGGVS
jgi:hypothetical protein